MVIGNGQLAQSFHEIETEGMIIFASGVSNSNCTNINDFNREKELLLHTLSENKDLKFVYFSSCALSSELYPKNKYYIHKRNMEKLIQEHTDNYYIFRVPQLFGSLIKHKTLINFFYESILNDNPFTVYNEAYRYVIEIKDVRLLVTKYLQITQPGIIVDIANSYRYKVEDIVKILESLLMKKAKYHLIDKVDKYELDLLPLNTFIIQNKINVRFGPNYLTEKLQHYIEQTVK